MKKMLLYLPAIVLTAASGCLSIIDGSLGEVLLGWGLWLVLFYTSGILLHRARFWGCFLGMIPAIQLIYMGSQHTGPILIDERPVGVVLLLYYALCGTVVYVESKKI